MNKVQPTINDYIYKNKKALKSQVLRKIHENKNFIDNKQDNKSIYTKK